MKILALNSSVPFPPVGGGVLRTYHLLRALAERHDVTLAAFTYGDEPGCPPFPIRIVPVPWQWPQAYREMNEGDPESAQRATHQLEFDPDEPWFASVIESRNMERALDLLAAEEFDAVLIERTDMARFLGKLPTHVPKVLDFHDVHTLMAIRAAEASSRDGQAILTHEAERTLRFEQRSASACALCLTCSEDEAAAVRRLLGISQVKVVPNGVDTQFFTPVDQHPVQRSLVFTGTMDYEPNIDGALYFVNDILPLIRAHVPDVTFDIVGARPTEDVMRLTGKDVFVRGMVPDMRPYYRRAEVVVVPLRRGGGTRVKILEAAASGKAIVTTSLGVEGLDFRRDEHLVVADSPENFAEAVISLFGDEARRKALESRARQAVIQYDWDGIGRQFCQLFETVTQASSTIC